MSLLVDATVLKIRGCGLALALVGFSTGSLDIRGMPVGLATGGGFARRSPGSAIIEVPVRIPGHDELKILGPVSCSLCENGLICPSKSTPFEA